LTKTSENLAKLVFNLNQLLTFVSDDIAKLEQIKPSTQASYLALDSNDPVDLALENFTRNREGLIVERLQ
jgi:hypothetical protein